jgi:phosphoglycolate phosphatase-like HAD superfamily hydrolase
MVLKLATWDWNATLIADTRACMDTDNHVLETFGGTPVTLKQYRETIIIPAVDFYAQHGCDREELLANSERLGKVFHSFYEPRAARCRTRRGAREALEFLKANSIDSVILSNHTFRGIEFQLKRLNIADYFAEILANSELDGSMKGRNKLDKLAHYLSTNGYKGSEVLIIGDSPEEIEIGRKLGLVTIAITRGYYSTSRLRAAKPDYLIGNLAEIKPIVESNQK